MHQVTSKDGTRIAYDKSGQGPAVVIVSGALSTRAASAELAKLLAPRFSVYSYDRRGRGESTDTQPYAVAREVEDLAAVIDVAGGSAFVYGKSSGACLALEAAASLADKIPRLALYEAPYDESEGAAQAWKDFRKKFDALLAAGSGGDGVELFMKFVGGPDEVIAGMKKSDAWPAMEKMAPTLAYDNAVLGEDRAVPAAKVAKVKATTLVMDGGASLQTMPFMRPTADKIAKLIPGAQRRTLEGQAHDVGAQPLAPVLLDFFGQPPA